MEEKNRNNLINKEKMEVMKVKNNLKTRKRLRLLTVILTVGSLLLCTFNVAYADGDPLAVIQNLSDFIFGLIRAIGMILLGFGVVQIGLSLKSHDPSQRANGFMTLAGGVVITFAKEILNLIVGG